MPGHCDPANRGSCEPTFANRAVRQKIMIF